jgi:hypothetical protein
VAHHRSLGEVEQQQRRADFGISEGDLNVRQVRATGDLAEAEAASPGHIFGESLF